MSDTRSNDCRGIDIVRLLSKKHIMVLSCSLIAVGALYVAAYCRCVKSSGFDLSSGNRPFIYSDEDRDRISKRVDTAFGFTNRALAQAAINQEFAGSYSGMWRAFDPLLFLDNRFFRRGYWSAHYDESNGFGCTRESGRTYTESGIILLTNWPSSAQPTNRP